MNTSTPKCHYCGRFVEMKRCTHVYQPRTTAEVLEPPGERVVCHRCSDKATGQHWTPLTTPPAQSDERKAS